jgi:hypothetical protein
MRLKTEMGAATNCPLFSSAFDLTVAASAAALAPPDTAHWVQGRAPNEPIARRIYGALDSRPASERQR